MSSPRLRFAPSPTGWLHVGNARIAMANAMYAKKHGGKLILRFDDTDAERNRPEYVQGIKTDLTWLGISWDESFAQSERLDRYAEVAEKLKAKGLLYPCFESEEELRVKREMKIKQGRAPVYDRAMLNLTKAQYESALANGKIPYWRFKLSSRTVMVDDAVLGQRLVKLPSVSDPVLIRTDGMPLYTFTSVVDDIDSGVTHIIRGEDHVTNTGVQIDIIEALGGKVPAFAHLPLLVDADGAKLSKRLEALSLRSLRADGVEPTAVAGFLARLGTADSPEPGTVETLAPAFELSRVSRSQPRFDIRQLLALNRKILHEASFASIKDRLPAGATEEFWMAIRGNLDLLSEARHWHDVVFGEIVPPPIESGAEIFAAAVSALPSTPWDGQTWKSWTTAITEATGTKGKALFQPLRQALTGEDHGPELAILLPLIGHEKVSARLRLAHA